VRDDPQQPAACAGTAVDTNERRLAEDAARLRQAELARLSRAMKLGELTAAIAHEVNQPIAAVVINAYAGLRWLGGENPRVEEARKALENIVRDGRRASAVVERIRASCEKRAGQTERLDLNDAIRDVLTFVAGELRSNAVKLRAHLSENLPRLLVDRQQLQQVILNLVINAIEAMSEVTDRARELSIDSRSTDSAVCISVHDSGPGLDQKSMERVFEAFHSTKPHGMGFGLSISRSIMEAHGGRIRIARNDCQGATFELILPIDHTTVA
jgi:C4-dicarboxylate-specific signal transduction histidine kinase